MECTYELIDALEDSDVIRNITEYKRDIISNSEIRELIDKGNSSLDDEVILEVKKRLYEFECYKGYMECYNELMFIVMDINKRFNDLIGSKGCFKI